MPGRGPQTFKKRQKEQQRKEKQEEKMAKRLARKHGTPEGGISDEEQAQDEASTPEHDQADAAGGFAA
jgi:hypothetical protein